ncbi:hypothetical protein CBR_g57595 [Chara braunii]|uniref:Uncharacterized protein n=1 Tax=Chara braunii TaxID=69332 RepID=A0A388LFK1_CHABU|nr:hypothetical protein CBR_g31657 [Chara braunii]GBG92869.1 hypothetical protein CBR_g57595 [Chara braunii]|eukprot:GBG81100.1 hypothetical protein CBR_g31657 [Chara braunii]
MGDNYRRLTMGGEKAIGIDLGTSTCCIAVWQHNRVDVIPNPMGGRLTPSVVRFSNTGKSVGLKAKLEEDNGAGSSSDDGADATYVYEIKRIMGKEFGSRDAQEDIRAWSFPVVGRSKGQPMVHVAKLKGRRQPVQFSPEEISAMLLKHAKKLAEAYLDCEVRKAVITVPAYFTDAQKEATRNAGRLARLEVVRLLSEPTAGALAYVENNMLSIRELQRGEAQRSPTVMVFDLGGGTLDVSIVEISEDSIVVKALDGDTHLGGANFDKNLVNYVVTEFAEKNRLLEEIVRADKRRMKELRKKCIEAKETLSMVGVHEYVLLLPDFYERLTLKEHISTTTFNRINQPLFDRCMIKVKRVLESANLRKEDILKVLLVGGSTRIPFVSEMMKDFFNGRAPQKLCNPDEAVGHGAAILAAKLMGERGTRLDHLTLREITPRSLGVDLHSGEMRIVIPRHSALPASGTCTLATSRDNQTCMRFPVYEGEARMNRDNHYLGEFTLKGFLRASRGEASAIVTLHVNEDCLVTATAKALTLNSIDGRESQITITADKGGLTDEDIKEMLLNEIVCVEDDEDNIKDEEAYEEDAENYYVDEPYTDDEAW